MADLKRRESLSAVADDFTLGKVADEGEGGDIDDGHNEDGDTRGARFRLKVRQIVMGTLGAGLPGGTN